MRPDADWDAGLEGTFFLPGATAYAGYVTLSPDVSRDRTEVPPRIAPSPGAWYDRFLEVESDRWSAAAYRWSAS